MVNTTRKRGIGDIQHNNISIVFSNPTTKAGICELIDANVNTNLVSYQMIDKVRDINLALDAFLAIALKAAGGWQFDDSNQTKDPIITTDLVLGQRDYHFTTDEQGNLILDIYRVMVANSNGIFYDLRSIDQQTKSYDTIAMVDGQNTQGQPTKYDKTGNGIFLDAIPNYSYTNGLKLFINRETTYFTSSDTTKKAGIDGRLQEYLAIRPTAIYAGRKGLQSANYWANELLKYEGDEDRGITGKIEAIYSKRSRDEKTQIIPTYRSSR